MSDESRLFVVHRLPDCPACHWRAWLRRELEGKLLNLQPRYRIECETVAFKPTESDRRGCLEWVTPWFRTSEEAIQVWTVTIGLSI